MDLNKVMIIGRLTRDPEVRSTTTGKTVASMTVATGRSWTGADGVKHEKSEFHNCVLWGKLGEIAGQYLTKGRQVYVEGRIETRDWTGTDGVKKYRTEIIVENMIMLGGQRSGLAAPPLQGAVPVVAQPVAFDAPEEEIIKVEDIPF